MIGSVTVTVRLPQRLKEKLEELATATRRSKSYLAAEAIEQYVDHELKIVGQILEGLADLEAGRVVSHAEVMADVAEAIRQAEAKKAAA